MSEALNTRPDTSNQSAGTHPDFSLGSLSIPASGSVFSTPGRPPTFRVPSTSTATSTAPLTTPSPPVISSLGRRKGTLVGSTNPSSVATAVERENQVADHKEDDDDDDYADYADTPAVIDRRRRIGGEMFVDNGRPRYAEPKTPAVDETPGATRPRRRTVTKGTTLTLRDQEKHIDHLKKENFDLKLRVHFLEDRLAQLAPEHTEAAMKQNINLKMEVHSRGRELKKLKKLVLELERELEKMQKLGLPEGVEGRRRPSREKELEEKLEEREVEIRELRKKLAGMGRHGDSGVVDSLRDAEERNAELEEELENVRGLLEENLDEIERLREMVERRGGAGDDVAMLTKELGQRIDRLQMENRELQEHLEHRAEDIEDLNDENITLRLTIEQLEKQREAESLERSQSRAQILEEREEREAVVDDLNSVRDKLAAVRIEMQQRDEEVEILKADIEQMENEHLLALDKKDADWRGEIQETETRLEGLSDALDERNKECEELRLQISELESQCAELNNKFEEALAHLERESEAKDNRIEDLEVRIEEFEKENGRLADELYELEDIHDRYREEVEKQREEDDAEREKHEAVKAALNKKVADLRSQLEEMTDMYESYSNEIHAHRSRQEELARHVEELVEQLTQEQEAHSRLQTEFTATAESHAVELKRERRILESKESALKSALADLARTQEMLDVREADLKDMQAALQDLEQETRRAGETQTTARFSLQLEVDRLKRDLERVEDELGRARKELEERERKIHELGDQVDKAHSNNRELTTQLGVQTQARLNLAEKLDGAQASLKVAEGEVGVFKGRVKELEDRLSKDQRSLISAESQYRDQLTERNTLLLTIYQYMDKILGVDKTPKKGGQAETKPFTNFSVFHDNLITRLKALSQIQLDFDRRSKEVESRFMEKITDMRKQLDHRWKQIDKFEASVKTLSDTKANWRKKFSAKEGEIEALKATNAELTTQLSALSKRSGQADPNEVKALSARVINAERRLNNAQNQLLASEEKIASMNQKSALADNKWEARVKEYEARLKAAEERVKRERQGSKERVAELENNVKSLQRQLELAQKRSQQLTEVVQGNRGTGSPGR